MLQVDNVFGVFDHKFKAHKLANNLLGRHIFIPWMHLSRITKNKRSKNNLDHFMVIPLGAPEVAHLVDHCFELVVHCLWLLSFVEDESTELSLDFLALGDLGHLVPFVRRLEDIPNFFGIFNPCTLLYSSRHKEARSIEVSWEL
jgi:hypothetical protein